jgi:hypothetical protein
MPGGLIQLIAYGAQNHFINGNPRMSFFKRVFRAYTHFSTESFTLQFLNQSQLTGDKDTLLSCKIRRFGDMLHNTYIVLDLPPIDTGLNGNEYYFRWVPYIGEVLLQEYWVSIGGSVIERRTGEWQHIWNELSMTDTKRQGYHALIGHDKALYDPAVTTNTITANPNYKIPGRRIWIPLPLWFCRDSGSALPLIGLQHHEVELYIRFRRLDDLYTVRHKNETVFHRPKGEEMNILTRIVHVDQQGVFGIVGSSLNIQARVDANFVFLGDRERAFFTRNAVDYIIEEAQMQVFVTEGINNVLNLTMNNIVKEMIWVFRPKNARDSNNWFLFTQHDGQEIMETSRLVIQGKDRFETKTSDYFGLIQPYHHHSRVPKKGVYCYNFGIHPEEFQPSGTLNASRLTKFQLLTTIRSNAEEYDILLFYMSYNFLRMIGGMGSLMWQT